MNINFNANETLKKIGRTGWNSDKNAFIVDILQGVEETDLYTVGKADLCYLMALAFLIGQKDGKLQERKRRKAYEAKMKKRGAADNGD